LERLNSLITDIQGNYNPDLKILGLLIVKYNEKTKIDRFLKGLIDRFISENGIKLFDTYIHESTAVNLAQGMSRNIMDLFPNNKISREYKKIAKEIDLLISNEKACINQ
jgi:chromosome partitioning protein